jgi:uncharacterized protein (DUF2384 family)
MKSPTKTYSLHLEELPAVRDFSAMYFYMRSHSQDGAFVQLLDQLIGISDKLLAQWLNVTPKTYRSYRSNPNLILKDAIKEHIALLLSLYKHGIAVFGQKESFEKWLTTTNPLLDGQAPEGFLDTITGIQFIDNRLTAMEYGENA